MKKSVCVLLKNSDKFLGVARRENSSDFGLPGGKVDDTDSSPEEAAIRELEEETGIKVDTASLTQVFDMICPGGKDGIDYHCTTYSVDSWTGNPKQGDAGPVEWVTKERLVKGSFGGYNAALFKTLEIKEMIEKKYGKMVIE